MNIIWAAAARRDLFEIQSYLEERNPIVAWEVIDHIKNIAEDMGRLPRRGRPGRVGDTRERVLTAYPYILIYAIDDDGINILRVLHAARIWPRE